MGSLPYPDNSGNPEFIRQPRIQSLRMEDSSRPHRAKFQPPPAGVFSRLRRAAFYVDCRGLALRAAWLRRRERAAVTTAT